MNKRPGIDTDIPTFFRLAKLNIPFDDRDRCIQLLRDLEMVRRTALSPERTIDDGGAFQEGGHVAPRRVVADLRLNLLVGFGLRFFLGALEQRGDEEVIPNFPPGGVFKRRLPTRFGIGEPVPRYLRRMNAAGDREWIAKRMGRDLKTLLPADTKVDAALTSWLSKSESDLFLYLESNNEFLVMDLWEQIYTGVVAPYGLQLVALHASMNRGDGRDHTGWFDGVSNLQDMMERDPERYRQHIYLPHPAPAFPGESVLERDPPAYDGGTYLVHRKYAQNLERWHSKDFTRREADGVTYTGEHARIMAIGRDRETGRVVHRRTGALLDHEYDSAETMLAPMRSHILKARGGSPAPFVGPFPPLKPGETHVFHIQDIRIRRRGGNFVDTDTTTGKSTHGLHFICFQNNIQQTGFEFINNVWLLNPAFRGGTDPLFDIEKGIVEPLEGCYYFVPPEHRDFPGDVFFAKEGP